MADLDLEEIRAMLAAATPGPWQALSWTAQDHDELTRDLSAMFGEGGLTVHFLWDGQPWNDTDKPALAPAITGNGRKSAENAALIASAPATIAALVAEVERLREDLGRLRWGVVANAGRLSTDRMPRWAHVKAATGFGSTSATALCRAAGFDPDEEVGGHNEGEAPHVCPGCYAVGDEPHLSYCIDDEMERERRHAIETGDYGVAGDGCGYGNECGRMGCPECQE